MHSRGPRDCRGGVAGPLLAGPEGPAGARPLVGLVCRYRRLQPPVERVGADLPGQKRRASCRQSPEVDRPHDGLGIAPGQCGRLLHGQPARTLPSGATHLRHIDPSSRALEHAPGKRMPASQLGGTRRGQTNCCSREPAARRRDCPRSPSRPDVLTARNVALTRDSAARRPLRGRASGGRVFGPRRGQCGGRRGVGERHPDDLPETGPDQAPGGAELVDDCDATAAVALAVVERDQPG